MGSRRITPSLDDAGFMVFQLIDQNKDPIDKTKEVYNLMPKDMKRHFVKLAIEIWRSVERCI
jgi:hypothetical protein